MHHVWLLMIDGALHCAPLPPKLDRVLDLGTGTGVWAVQFADDHPETEVVGTDLSPIQPTWYVLPRWVRTGNLNKAYDLTI